MWADAGGLAESRESFAVQPTICPQPSVKEAKTFPLDACCYGQHCCCGTCCHHVDSAESNHSSPPGCGYSPSAPSLLDSSESLLPGAAAAGVATTVAIAAGSAAKAQVQQQEGSATAGARPRVPYDIRGLYISSAIRYELTETAAGSQTAFAKTVLPWCKLSCLEKLTAARATGCPAADFKRFLTLICF